MWTISLTYNGKHEDIPVDGLGSLGILLSRVNLHQIYNEYLENYSE